MKYLKEKKKILCQNHKELLQGKIANGIIEIYLKIDNKNSLNQVDEDYISEFNYRFCEYEKENEDFEIVKKIMNKYYEKRNKI